MAESDGREVYWRYLRAAFGRRIRVPLLGELPLNTMVLGTLGVLGLANPGFWFIGIAGELLYLVLRASNPRFQKLIEAERLMNAQRSWSEQVESAVSRLDAASRARYRKLLGTCRQILGISGALDADSLGGFRDLRARSLNQLLAIFLRLLASRDAIVANLLSVDETRLEADIAELERRIATAGGDPALTRSLQGTLDIQRKRLDNRNRAAASLAVIDAELERIERQVELIREEAAVSGRPEQLSERLDAVTGTMAETSRWIEQHADLFSELSADEAAVLPELPKALEGES